MNLNHTTYSIINSQRPLIFILPVDNINSRAHYDILHIDNMFISFYYCFNNSMKPDCNQPFFNSEDMDMLGDVVLIAAIIGSEEYLYFCSLLCKYYLISVH